MSNRVIRVSEYWLKPIVMYEYTPNRKPENAEKFLKGFRGYLHTDWYQGLTICPERLQQWGAWC
ncbi:MAG: transposase [Eubacteriales bacterium]